MCRFSDALKVEDLDVRKEEEAEETSKTEVPTIVPQLGTTNVKADSSKVNGTRSAKTCKDKTNRAQTTNLSVERCSKYTLLKYLAREPLRRVTQDEQCEIPDNLRNDYVYHSFKNKLLQENLFFDPFVINYNPTTLEGAADINRCIRQGLINISDCESSELQPTTKSAILNIQNFENLSLPMRYCVIRSHLKKQKRFIQSATEKQLQEITELGVNVRDSYKIMKVIADDMKQQILLRQQLFHDIKRDNEEVDANSDKTLEKKKKAIKKKKL